EKLPALVDRKASDLPVCKDGVPDFVQPRYFRRGVDEVEGQRQRRDILQCPHTAVGIKEVLPGGPSEAFSPGECAAGLQAVREALGGLHLQRVVLGVSGRGSRRKKVSELREGVQDALQRGAGREAGVREKVGDAVRGCVLNHVGAADRSTQQDTVVVVVVGRAGADSAASGARPGSRVRVQAKGRVLLRGGLAQEAETAAR